MEDLFFQLKPQAELYEELETELSERERQGAQGLLEVLEEARVLAIYGKFQMDPDEDSCLVTYGGSTYLVRQGTCTCSSKRALESGNERSGLGQICPHLLAVRLEGAKFPNPRSAD